jgi:hypothetical protein
MAAGTLSPIVARSGTRARCPRSGPLAATANGSGSSLGDGPGSMPGSGGSRRSLTGRWVRIDDRWGWVPGNFGRALSMHLNLSHYRGSGRRHVRATRHWTGRLVPAGAGRGLLAELHRDQGPRVRIRLAPRPVCCETDFLDHGWRRRAAIAIASHSRNVNHARMNARRAARRRFFGCGAFQTNNIYRDAYWT